MVITNDVKMVISKVPVATERIGYIDALRGFTMLLVVLHHVASVFIVPETPSYHHYLQQIRMPMFFLVSGFVLYKAGVVWNLNHIGGFLKKKFVVQISSTLIFFIIYIHLKEVGFFCAIKEPAKLGYWFTYTLFFFYVFYALIRYICGKHEEYVVIIVAAVFYVINWPPLYTSIPIPENVKTILGIENWFYFSFFLLGTLMKKHFDYIQRSLDKRMTMVICILLFFLLNIYHDILPSDGVGGVIIQFCKNISGVLILFSLFRNKQAMFAKEMVLGRCLQYIGRRTLDIYLLHFFFLPNQLKHVTSIFKEYPMPVVEFTCSFIIACIVIAFCLLISNVIRLSPLLAHWLFGVKIPITTQPLRNETDCSDGVN